MKIDPTDLIDANDVAALLGLAHRQAVSTYRHRYPNFPEPVFERSQCVLWLKGDIARWEASHRHKRGPLPKQR